MIINYLNFNEMRKIILVLISSVGVIYGMNAQSFGSLTASGSNKKIEWTTSNWGSGFGHKIYSFDPGGKTLLNIAARHNTSSWTDLMTFSSDGKVGIGTSSPTVKLDVNGSVKFDNIASDYSNLQIGHDVNDRIFADNGDNKHYGGGMFFRVTPNPALTIRGNYIDVMMLTDYGNVGIGTRTTGPHKLAVNGSIGAREVKVETTAWADFVFYKDYKLPTLKEVEAHIKEKGHLQDIPSAKEVQENGIFLGEMNAKLLQKIEELMLYTLDQEKKLTHQEKEITTLKEQFIQLEKKIKNN